MEISSLSEIDLLDTDLVLLDLDNTLYEYRPCHEKALTAVIDQVSIQYEKEKTYINNLYMECRQMVHERHKGTAAGHSRLFYLQGMIERICGITSVESVALLYKLYWDVYIDVMNMPAAATEFLDTCLLQNIPIVLVTDMIADVQFRKIIKLKIEKYLQFVVTSEEAGVEKPNPLIFEMAIGKAVGQNPFIKKIVVIGDDKKKDVYSSLLYDVNVYHITSK